MNTSGQDNLTNMESSYPSSDRLSIQNIFICPISDLNFKNNLVPGKTDKFLLKLKIPCILRTGVLLIKNHQYPLKVNGHGASLFAEILAPQDISYPFNYFW
jgi:hypothetical protein